AIGGGLLLYGPPGCGKTLISKAAAGEIDAHFFALGLHQILDMYVGGSEKNLHRAFQLARDHAPAILFFDEVDALACNRKDMRNNASRTLVNQFLSELDGTDGANEGVLVIGATNAPWQIDPAFRRPGRFDRNIFTPPPDLKARKAIIEVLARDKPIADLDSNLLASKTEHFSGADLQAMFDRCIESTLSQAVKEGKIVPLTTRALIEAAGSVRPSTRSWFDTARNYALYANQSGHYDDVLRYLDTGQ
ncbi:MAG: ATP-binding protein, partial [Verrucomicrobiota bacterium]